ncbi:YaiI/YqxD family protein [Hydrogenimonas sp. SS33]|uniref:YaiI/YqxD family protein n=1 Tax=Hydrogenimonas leucolamina TaxID=2954236 RepID=UPI00336BBFB2
MTLYIDGDALPNLLKPILLRGIEKYGLPTRVVANRKISIGTSPHIETVVVGRGADKADDRIVEMLRPGDLVITADIPLADRVISAGGSAIDHRGERYTPDNIKQYLAMRNLMEAIRESGETTKGPKPFGPKDAHAFANQFNRFLQGAFSRN